MGCAYMYLFQFKEASECFLKAYRLLGTRQALKHYLTACYMDEEECFSEVCKEMEAPEGLEEEIRSSLKEAGEQVAAPRGEAGELLGKFIRDYHRSTGF